MTARSRRPVATRALLVLSSYVLVLALFNLRWILGANDQVVESLKGVGSDTRLHMWILWWVSYALTHAPWSLLDAPINYPATGQLTGSEHFATSQLLFAPVYWLSGNPVLALNVTLLATYPLSALAMNRLLLALGLGVWPAWAGGLVFALGPLTVPASSHILHHLTLFFPLVALMLLRLRRDPSRRWTVALAVSLLLGMLSAFYMAAMLSLCALVWIVAEALRSLPRRKRFLVLSGGVLLGCALILALTALPYLGRLEVWDYSAGREEGLAKVQGLFAMLIFEAPQGTFGFSPLILASLGLVGLVERDLRRIALIALVLIALGATLAAGGVRFVSELSLPEPLHSLVALPARFFRVSLRFSVVAGFGVALLASLAFELAARHFSRTGAIAGIGLAVLALLGERGGTMWRTSLERVDSAGRYQPVYRSVGEIASAKGGGPLLELPIRNRGWNTEADAMVGSIWHGLPLIIGHTGYLPRHRLAVNEQIFQLPAKEALDELMRTTGVRWILIRPPTQPEDRWFRDRLVKGLGGLSPVMGVYPIEGWVLLQLSPVPATPPRLG